MRFIRMQFHFIKMRYSIEPRDFCPEYLSFAKNMGKNWSNNYGQKRIDSVKKSTTDAIKIASKRAIQKTTETTGDLIRNKVADKIQVSQKSPQPSCTLKKTNDKLEVPKKDTYLQKKGSKLLMNKVSITI